MNCLQSPSRGSPGLSSAVRELCTATLVSPHYHLSRPTDATLAAGGRNQEPGEELVALLFYQWIRDNPDQNHTWEEILWWTSASNVPIPVWSDLSRHWTQYSLRHKLVKSGAFEFFAELGERNRFKWQTGRQADVTRPRMDHFCEVDTRMWFSRKRKCIQFGLQTQCKQNKIHLDWLTSFQLFFQPLFQAFDMSETLKQVNVLLKASRLRSKNFKLKICTIICPLPGKWGFVPRHCETVPTQHREKFDL